ncbi:unnamed protein product, partial [Urochloa humidicola]
VLMNSNVGGTVAPDYCLVCRSCPSYRGSRSLRTGTLRSGVRILFPFFLTSVSPESRPPSSMSDAYKKAKAGRLVFKGGEAASLHKPKKHKKKNKKPTSDAPADGDVEAAAAAAAEGTEGGSGAGAGDDYTIDAAKKMKYEELFPVEAKKFGYDPANAARVAARNRSVEEALDDRVRKKADRYCK